MPIIKFKWWIITSICLFSIGLAAGLAVPTSATDLLSEELDYLKELASLLGPFQASTAAFIFLKNVGAVLVSFLFSPILCLLPVFALTVNGLLLSFVSVMVLKEYSVGLLVAGILPHGVFELPALIIGEAAALSFGFMVILSLFNKEAREQLPANSKRSLRYLILSTALLVPAAIIETFVTPLFIT